MLQLVGGMTRLCSSRPPRWIQSHRPTQPEQAREGCRMCTTKLGASIRSRRSITATHRRVAASQATAKQNEVGSLVGHHGGAQLETEGSDAPGRADREVLQRLRPDSKYPAQRSPILLWHRLGHDHGT